MQHEMQHENDTIFQALGVIRAPKISKIIKNNIFLNVDILVFYVIIK